MLKGRRVLVTGATGFIGARLVERLVQTQGAVVTAGIRDHSKAARLAALDVSVRRVDLGDRARVTEAVRGQDVVINLAHDFRASARRNVGGLVNLADACSAAGVGRLVHTSSIAVYDGWPTQHLSEASPRGGPGSEYKTAKAAMEMALSDRASRGQLDSIIVQPTIVYGPSSWLWTDQIVERLVTGTVVLPDPCPGCCNAVYVDDVAEALILAAVTPEGGAEPFIISGPAPVLWREFFQAYDRMLGTDAIRYQELAETVAPLTSRPVTLQSVMSNPMQVAHWPPVRHAVSLTQRMLGARAIDALRAVALNLTRRRGPITYTPSPSELALYRSTGVCRIDKAVTQLGYAPAFDFARGIEQTAAYVKERHPTSQTASQCDERSP